MHYVLPTSNPDATHYYTDIFSDQINSLEKLREKEILHIYDTLQSFMGAAGFFQAKGNSRCRIIQYRIRKYV